MFNRFLLKAAYTDLDPLRFIVASTSLMWALMSFLPGDLFIINQELFSIIFGPNWQFLFIFNETFWSLVFLFHALVTFFFLWRGIKGTRMTIIFECFLGLSIWTVSFFMCLYSHLNSWTDYQPPTVLSAAAVIGILQWWILVRQLLLCKGCFTYNDRR